MHSCVRTYNSKPVNGGAKIGHGGGAKPGQLVRVCAMARALST